MKKQKIYDVLLFIVIFIIIMPNILIQPLNNLDELWNYNFARNIANGLIPYKDFNMVITPLLSIICGIVLKLICNELIIMRILAGILHSAILYLIYKLLNILDIKTSISIIFSFCIGYLFKDFFCIDYNYFSLLLCLCIIYNEIKLYKKDEIFIKCDVKHDLIVGILTGLILATKQTVGAFMCIALLGNKLLFVRKKEEFNIFVKSFIYRLIGISIPVILLILYLLINNAIYDFINYTICGITSFSNYIPYTNLLHNNFIISELSVLVPIVFIYSWIKTICLEKEKINYIFLVYGLAMFVVCFPISDKIHFLTGAMPTIIFILYKFYFVLKEIVKKFSKKRFLYIMANIVIYICLLFILWFCCKLWINFYNDAKDLNYSKLNHYKCIPIDEQFDEEIMDMSKYIVSSNKDIKILDSRAVVYMIPAEKYNKDYDMLNNGNLGENGDERIIGEIAASSNTQYLILKDRYIKNWQTPLSIIDYVKNNKTKIGEIEIFDIYE